MKCDLQNQTSDSVIESVRNNPNMTGFLKIVSKKSVTEASIAFKIRAWNNEISCIQKTSEHSKKQNEYTCITAGFFYAYIFTKNVSKNKKFLSFVS